MIIGKDILKYREDIIHHTCELVKMPSKRGQPEDGAPFGRSIANALDYVLKVGSLLGLKAENIDGYAGHVEFGDGKDGLVGVLVHLDVVPEGTGWTYPPYGALIENDRIYGRGASDDKGPAIAALFSLKVLKDSGLNFSKRVRIIFGTNEESGMQDMEYYFRKEPLPDMGFSPDAGYPIINREKGIMRLALVEKRSLADETINHDISVNGGEAANMVAADCTAEILLEKLTADEIQILYKQAEKYPDGRITLEKNNQGENTTINIYSKGKSSHGASPSGGINAIAHLACFLSETGLLEGKLMRFLHDKIGFESDGESLGIKWKDTEAGDVTVNLGTVTIGKQDESEAILDVRYPMSCSGDEIIGKLKLAAAENGLELRILGHREPLYVPAEHQLIERLGRAYRKITGKEAGLIAIGGGTYARTLKNNGVAFGGAEGGNVHQPDEFVLIESLMEHAVICTQAIYELLLD